VSGLPSEPIRREHRALLVHLRNVEAVAARVGEWDVDQARNDLPQIVKFLTEDLIPHAQAEDDVLYPAIDRIMGAKGTATMRVDHDEIGGRIMRLAAAADEALVSWNDRGLIDDISRQLTALAAIILLHFRKEEEVLLPILDFGLSVGDVRDLYERMGHTSLAH
jgi:iron-sulfur cluster repair protein YtfE (RIC family)